MMVLTLACAAGGIFFARVRVVILAKRTPKAQGDFKAFPPHSPHGFELLYQNFPRANDPAGYAGYLKRWSKFVFFL